MKKDLTLLSRHDLAIRGLKYSNTHLLYLEKIGAFPRRIRISPQRVCWAANEIDQYLQARIDQRNGGRR